MDAVTVVDAALSDGSSLSIGSYAVAVSTKSRLTSSAAVAVVSSRTR